MFRCLSRRLAIGAYSLFMIEQKENPKLKGLPVSERGTLTSKLYKALSKEEKEALLKRAASYPSHQRAQKTTAGSKAPPKKRQPSVYAKFVKDNIHKFDQLPQRERMAAVAKLWKQQNPSH